MCVQYHENPGNGAESIIALHACMGCGIQVYSWDVVSVDKTEGSMNSSLIF